MRLVDLDEVIDAIESTDWYHLFNGKLSEGAEDEDHALYRATDIYKAIGEVPVMDAEPVVHGKWIYLDKDNKFFKKHIVECSLCNNSLDLYAVNGGRGDANYCPNCGAKMEKPE